MSENSSSDNKEFKLESVEEIKDENIDFDDFKTFEEESRQFNNSPSEFKRDHFETHDTSINFLDTNYNPATSYSSKSTSNQNKQLFSTARQEIPSGCHKFTTKPENDSRIEELPYESRKTEITENEQKIIMGQYEALLQQLAAQLEKQIKRNKDLEALISAQAQKSTRIIEVLREHAEKEIEELSLKLKHATQERDELKAKVGQIESEYKQIILEKEQENQLTSELKRKLDLDGMSKMHMGQVEENMRKVMSQINEKNIMFEAELRKKEEEIFTLKNYNTQLKDEIETHKEINKQLKNDYGLLMQRKGEVDSEIQKLTNKIYADEIASHKMLQENDKLNRAVSSLNDAREAMERSLEEVKRENLELKQLLTDSDKEKTLLSTRLEKAHRDYQTLEIALMKAENTIKLQHQTISDLQSDYNTLVEHEKSSLPTDIITSGSFFGREKPVLESKSVSEKQNNQQEIKTRYQEYKQRQTTSTLNDVFKWNEDSKIKNLKEKSPFSKTSEERDVSKSFFKKKEGENSDQIAKLQNSLQMLLNEKQKLEKEYSKFPPKSEKIMSHKKRKEEIEFELDLNEKNIQRTKFKLRELNAL